MQDKNIEDDNALKDQIDELEDRIKQEQLRSQKALNELKGEHQVKITEM